MLLFTRIIKYSESRLAALVTSLLIFLDKIGEIRWVYILFQELFQSVRVNTGSFILETRIVP
jgi:hypothetical protein